MGKRNKQRPGNASGPSHPPAPAKPGAASARFAAHAPAQNPTLLAVSVLLFALWFIFLLVTALTG